MCRLSLDEIIDGQNFEDLTSAFFRCLPKIHGTNIYHVEVESAGIGADGGVDILVHIYMYDGMQTIKRTYIIQCKFHNANINRAKIGTANITELIMANKACGYILICKKNATSALKQYFVKLEENCFYNFFYQIWSGEEFLSKLHEAPAFLIKQFFPRYFGCINGKN